MTVAYPRVVSGGTATPRVLGFAEIRRVVGPGNGPPMATNVVLVQPELYSWTPLPDSLCPPLSPNSKPWLSHCIMAPYEPVVRPYYTARKRGTENAETKSRKPNSAKVRTRQRHVGL